MLKFYINIFNLEVTAINRDDAASQMITHLTDRPELLGKKSTMIVATDPVDVELPKSMIEKEETVTIFKEVSE